MSQPPPPPPQQAAPPGAPRHAAALIELASVSRSVRLPDDTVLPILVDVDLQVRAGEHVAVVGRSGSGKSTLLNLVGLLDSPTTGTYHLDGAPTDRLSARHRARLRGETFGFVFQQFNLLARRTAVENVAAPLLYARGTAFWTRARRAREMLDAVGLGHRADSMPEQMSGGEQQRVAIARSLVRSPRVLLADEPTGSLDVDTGAGIMDLLAELVVGTGATLVTITHDLGVAARADRQYRIDHGRLSMLAASQVAPATADRGPAQPPAQPLSELPGQPAGHPA